MSAFGVDFGCSCFTGSQGAQMSTIKVQRVLQALERSRNIGTDFMKGYMAHTYARFGTLTTGTSRSGPSIPKQVRIRTIILIEQSCHNNNYAKHSHRGLHTWALGVSGYMLAHSKVQNLCK